MNTKLLTSVLGACAVALGGCSSANHKIASCCDRSAAATTTTLPVTPPEADPDEGFISRWLPPDQRPVVALDDRVTTHAGLATTLRDLADRPLAISFAYTRCTNPNKCPRVVSTMGALHHEVERAGLLGRVRLLVITYDSAYDTPVVLRSFAKLHGLPLDAHTLFLRPDPQVAQDLFSGLGVRASFNDGGVAIHGIQLLLLDRHGRLARGYHTLLWDNTRAINDLARLADEP